MKKKMILALAFVLVVAFAAVGCGDKGDSTSKKYIIGTDTTFPPFEYQDAETKEFVGIDLDILDAIAKDQGFEYELNSLGFDAAVQALEAGQVDGVIAGMSITKEREKKSDFSEPYFESGVIMGIKAGDSKVTWNEEKKLYEGLKGQNVAVKANTMGREYALSIKDQYGFTVSTFEDSPMMYQEVLTGNAVACFEDTPVLKFGIQNGNGLETVGSNQKANKYGFAVKKDKNAELLKLFNAGLKNIKENGTYDEIMIKYGQDVSK